MDSLDLTEKLLLRRGTTAHQFGGTSRMHLPAQPGQGNRTAFRLLD